MSHDFQVIEDNAGGLHLFVFDEGECIYAAMDWETSPTRHLLADTAALLRDPAAGLSSIPLEWEGGEDDPRGAWHDMKLNRLTYELWYKVIADQNGIYYDLMGVAGQKEFGPLQDYMK